MATELDVLLIKISADTAALRGEMAKANAAVAKSMVAMQREAAKTNAAFEKIGAAFKAGLLSALSALSVSRLADFARETLEWADSTKSLADRLGISTDALQELIFAGREVNITTAEMTKGMESFAVKFAEAASGKGRGVQALKELGINARDAQGNVKGLETVFSEFQKKIQQFDRTSQLALAKSFFGDEGAAKFLEFLATMDEGRKKARELGVVIDAELLQRGEQLNKEFERFGDVTLAKVRGVTLEIAVGFADILKSITDISPETEKIASKLADITPVLGGFKALFEGVREARRLADAVGESARIGAEMVGDVQFRPARTGTTGRRTANLDTGAASALEGFEKKIFAIRHQAAALNQELKFDKATAAFNKAVDDFADVGGKVKPTGDQIARFTRSLKEIEGLKPAIAFKDMAVEADRLTQIIAAEVSGNRALVTILEQRFSLEDKFGRKLTDAETARADALAKTRFEMEQLRERSRAALQELEGIGRDVFSTMGGNLNEFFQQGANGWDILRTRAINALNQIGNKLQELAFNDLFRALGSQNQGPGLGDLFRVAGGLLGGLGGLGGAGSTAASFIPAVGGFASGGSFRVPGAGGTDSTPVGFMATPGERVTIQTPGQVRRGGDMGRGGGNTIIIDARAANDPAAVEAAAYRAVIKAAPHMVAASVDRVRDRAWRDPSYLPR